MKKASSLILFLLLTLNFSYLKAAVPYRNVMYYQARQVYNSFYPSMMKPKYITHLNLAFLDLDSNGDLVLTDEYADFQIEKIPELSGLSYGDPYAGVLGALFVLKLKNPHLKIGISVGGWGRDANFPIVAADATKRDNFAKNIVKFIEYLGYDFVDIDWEYPSSSDKENFTKFLKAIRNRLDELEEKMGKHYELSIAASAEPKHMDDIEWDKVLEILDFSNMMTYDLAGEWDSYTAHHTGLYTNEAYNHKTMSDGKYSADYCFRHFEETYGSSIDMKQITVGVAPYSRGWLGVKNDGLDPNNPGLFATASPRSMEDESYGIWEIPDLIEKYELKEYFDNTAKAAYYYSSSQGVFLTIDNAKSALEKGKYVKEKDLGGLIAWEASLDKENVVTKAMFDSLYEDGYTFPDDEYKYSIMDFTAQITATKKGYEITIKNNEKSAETNVALKDAELFQKSISFMKLYIKTKSGAEFSSDDSSITVTNKDGIGIVDPTGHSSAKHISPKGSYTFSIIVSGTPDVSDIEKITLTQRVTPSLPEFKEQIVYKA